MYRAPTGDTAVHFQRSLADLRAATAWMVERNASADKQPVLAAATPYLRLFGLVAGGGYLIVGALGDSRSGDDRATLARFYGENLIGEASALRRTVEGGAARLAAASEALVQ